VVRPLHLSQPHSDYTIGVFDSFSPALWEQACGDYHAITAQILRGTCLERHEILHYPFALLRASVHQNDKTGPFDRLRANGGGGEWFGGSLVCWLGDGEWGTGIGDWGLGAGEGCALVGWFVGSVVRGRGIRLPRADGSALAMTGAHNPLESPLPLRQAQDRLKGENRPQ